MKKLAVALAVIIVAVLALPVSAAQINLGGKLSSKLHYDFVTGSGMTTDLKLQLNIGTAVGNKLRGVVEINPMTWKFINGSGPVVTYPSNYGIKTAYIEAEGPYWTGGPVVTTRMGDLDLAYSPFILSTKVIDGMSISGMNVGPVAIDGFYGFGPGTKAMGGRVRADLSIAEMDAALVKVGSDEIDYVAKATAEPMDNLAIEGLVAGQTNNNTTAIRAAAAYGIDFLPLPFDVLATVGYRQTSGEFAPTYRLTEKGNPIEGQAGISAVTAGLATSVGGFDISVDGEILGSDDDWKLDNERSIGAAVGTTVAGLDVRAGHRITQEIAPEAKVTNETGIGIAMNERAILPNVVVSASYDATMTNFAFADMRHVARAAVGADMGAFRGVKLAALLDTKPDEGDPGRELKLEYGAPNGVNMGYTYNDIGSNRIYAGAEVSF